MKPEGLIAFFFSPIVTNLLTLSFVWSSWTPLIIGRFSPKGLVCKHSGFGAWSGVWWQSLSHVCFGLDNRLKGQRWPVVVPFSVKETTAIRKMDSQHLKSRETCWVTACLEEQAVCAFTARCSHPGPLHSEWKPENPRGWVSKEDHCTGGELEWSVKASKQVCHWDVCERKSQWKGKEPYW